MSRLLDDTATVRLTAEIRRGASMVLRDASRELCSESRALRAQAEATHGRLRQLLTSAAYRRAGAAVRSARERPPAAA